MISRDPPYIDLFFNHIDRDRQGTVRGCPQFYVKKSVPGHFRDIEPEARFHSIFSENMWFSGRSDHFNRVLARSLTYCQKWSFFKKIAISKGKKFFWCDFLLLSYRIFIITHEKIVVGCETLKMLEKIVFFWKNEKTAFFKKIALSPRILVGELRVIWKWKDRSFLYTMAP